MTDLIICVSTNLFRIYLISRLRLCGGMGMSFRIGFDMSAIIIVKSSVNHAVLCYDKEERTRDRVG